MNNVKYYEVAINGEYVGNVDVKTHENFARVCERYGYEYRAENDKEIITNGKTTYEYCPVV